MRTERHLSAEPAQEAPTGRPPAMGNRVAAAPAARRLAVERLRLSAEADPLEQVRRREGNYRRALVLADMVAAAISVPLAVLGHGLDGSDLILVPAIVLTAKILGLYDRDELVVQKTTIDELPRLVSLASTFTLVVWATRHQMVGGASGTAELIGLWVALAATLTGGRTLARRVAGAISSVERLIVLGDVRAYDRLARPIAERRNVCLVGCVALKRVLEDGPVLQRLATTEHVHRIIIAPDATLMPEDVLELVRRAKATGLRVSLLPSILEAVGSSVVCDDVGGVTLLGVPRFGLTRSSAAVKRGFDVAGASALLLVGLPVMAVASVLIRLDSTGRVLFRQTRVGRDGRHFSMIKLRTMVDGADALKADLMALNETHGLFKIAEDPRITRVGRWLRRTNLDELPQLVNVLRGEMSLVGPRPLVVEEDERVVGIDRRRLHLKPGMTGPWQTLGQRVPLSEMVKVDYLYIANWSLWIDLKILMRTVPYVARGRGR